MSEAILGRNRVTAILLCFALTYGHSSVVGAWALPTMTFLASVPMVGAPAARSRRTDLLYCAHYYKDAMLGRFYAICNCCSCCCGAMKAWAHGAPMLASSGYVARADAELCAGCASCADDCPFAAISVDDGFARINAAELT